MKTRMFVHLLVLIAVLISMLGDASPIQAAPRVIYVDVHATGGANDGTSWVNAYVDFQAALASADTGDEIWAADGIYKPTSAADRTISFQLKNDVALYGGFKGIENVRDQRDWNANVTILSGDIGNATDNSDNSYHVVNGSGVDRTAILDGFTITAGKASGSHTATTTPPSSAMSQRA